MPPKKVKIPDPLPAMPNAYDVRQRLDTLRNLPFNLDRSQKEDDVIRRALLSVWQPRWDSLAARMEGERKRGIPVPDREYVRLYAQRGRVFPGMKNAARGFPYYDQHHDWAQETQERLQKAVERANDYPTIQEIDPYTAEYLPKGKTLRYDDKTPIYDNHTQVIYLQDGYGRARNGDACIGVVFPVGEGKKRRLRLYVFSDLLSATKIEMSQGYPYGFGFRTAQNVKDWLSFIGPRQIAERPPEPGYTVKGDKKIHGYLLYAGEYLP